MIIFKCDICGKQTNKLDSIVLYKKGIDYCKDCKKEVTKLQKDYKKEIDYENVIFDFRLREKETKMIKEVITKEKEGC